MIFGVFALAAVLTVALLIMGFVVIIVLSIAESKKQQTPSHRRD